MTPTQTDEVTTTTQPVAAPSACPNCGEVATVRTRYCGGCGQRVGVNQLTVRNFLAEILDDAFSLNGRLPSTLRALFCHPGLLTREFAAGRIARYVRPFRLYLISSVIFFLALSLTVRLDSGHVKIGNRIEVQGAAKDTTQAPATTSPTTADSGATETAAPGEPAIGDSAPNPAGHREPSMVVTGVDLTRQPDGRLAQLLEPFVESAREDPGSTMSRLVDRILKDVPKAIVVILPIFALFLKLLYFDQRRLYVEHLVFVFHIHAFAFLVAAALILLPDRLTPWYAWLVIPGYIFLAMRRVYGQSFLRTALNWFVFGCMYTASVAFTLLTVTIFAAVMLSL